MTQTGYHLGRDGRQRVPQRSGPNAIRALILLAALLVAGCQPGPAARPAPGAPANVSGGQAPGASAFQGAAAPAASPPATVAIPTAILGPAAPSAVPPAALSPTAGGAAAAVATAGTDLGLIEIPILGAELAPGWDTVNSWSAGLAKSADRAPSGAPAWAATFPGDSGGVFFAVRQNSPRRYLAGNYLGLRLWINPGSSDLAADRLSLAILSNDQHAYWRQDDQPVPPQDFTSAGESSLLPAGATMPAGAWSKVEIWFRKMPSPPRGRYLTGLYLRANGMAERSIRIAGLGFFAIPDSTEPAPLAASVVDLNSFRVTFNEDVDPIAAGDAGNYRIGSAADAAYGVPRAPSSVEYQPDSMSAVLAVPETLKPDVEYTVEVQRIADLAPEPRVQAAPVRLAFTAKAFVVSVDAAHPAHPISPLIYGIAGASADYLKALHPTLNNWGGNPSTRYNWQLGNAWNAGSDWEYRNTDYGYKSGSVSDDFVAEAQAAGADVRMALPTLGWVARNTDINTCSFTGPDGKCMNPGTTCAKPGPIADPNRANVPSDVNSVVQWVEHMIDEKGLPIRFFAFDNEPDLWGYTHYDVHPNCTTYDEILSKYLEYASAVRAVAPKAELLGPVSCCWYFYWNSAAGDADKAKHDKRDFLPWFLDQVRQHDEKGGVRTLDALDIHYYPEGFYNNNADASTSRGRLQETRSLWDKTYVDPSWIKEPVNLIPRMQQVIADHYPGTKLFISEWNFGADKTMNGALALADVLGIFGQEDLYAASYWRYPELNSPGFFAFKMYTNYDDKGSRFGDTALPATSSNRDQVSVYASRDSRTGATFVMLVNKLPDRSIPAALQIQGLTSGQAQLFRYTQDRPEGITKSSLTLSADATVTLPPYSITLLVIPH